MHKHSWVLVRVTLVTFCVTAAAAMAGAALPAAVLSGASFDSLFHFDPSSGAGIALLGSATAAAGRWPAMRERARSTQGRIYAFLAAAALVLLSIAIVAFATITSLRERAQWVEHSYQVRVQFEQMMEQYQRVRIGWRSFLIANREDYSRDFEAARQQLPKELRATQALTADNPRQQQRLAALSRLMSDDVAGFSDGVQARREGRLNSAEAAQAYLEPVRFHVAEIESAAREFRADENALLAERVADSRIGSRNVVIAIFVGNAAGLLILIYAFLLLKRQNDVRTRLEGQLQSVNQELESKVDARTRELAALNATLEERIAERTAELDDLYNNAPCGYHSIDTANFIIRMNDTELRWLGYTRDEVIGRMRFTDLHTPESAERHRAHSARFKEAGMRVLHDVEAEFVRKDGSVLAVALSVSAVRDAQGRFVRSRTSVYDITERKRVKQEILALNADLEERARELQLTNQELESFSYSVSHDLRTPLRAIDGFALMLEEDHSGRLDDEGRRLLGVIRDNSRKMGALIESLLRLARLGRQQMNRASVAMNPLVEEVILELVDDDERCRARIDISELPAVSCDRALLRQVWVNLISNALKYSARVESPRIAISARQDGAQITYRVSDNGAGFDMQYAPKLFGVFQRLHRAEDFGGTGVGLAIVQRIVKRHGGHVRAEGMPGAGATFEFTLPLGAADD